MTATDELRRMLDERGVEHFGDGYQHITTYRMADALASVTETSTGKLMLRATFETPEQAIEATLGRGKCIYEIAAFGDGKAWFQCSECGGMASAEYDPPKYCPHCGCKVVDE